MHEFELSWFSVDVAFWLRQNVTIEIPTVEYRHHAILQVGSPLDTRPRIWTTSSALNGLLGSQLVPASIEVGVSCI